MALLWKGENEGWRGVQDMIKAFISVYKMVGEMH